MTFDPTILSAVQTTAFASQALTNESFLAAQATMAPPLALDAFANDDSRSSFRYVLMGSLGAAAVAMAGCGSSSQPQQTQTATGARDPFCEAQDATMERMQHEKHQFDQAVFGIGIGLGLVTGLIVGRIWGKRKAMAKMRKPAETPPAPPAAPAPETEVQKAEK